MGRTAKQIRREQELNETVQKHRGRLSALLRRLLRDSSEIEDVLQETFEEYVEAYDIGETFDAVGAWLARVARNKVLDRFRRKKTQDDYRLLVESAPEAAADEGDEWARERFREAIVAALEKLPPEQRDVFIQNELEGKTFEEIARTTGVSINTLLSRKRYAVLALRDFLKEVYDELQ